MQKIANILLHRPFDQTYTYRIPESMDVAEGDLVVIPVRGQRCVGVVDQVLDDSVLPSETLRYISEAFPIQIPPSSLLFIKRVAHYTLAPVGTIFRMMIPSPDKILRRKQHFVYQKTDLDSGKNLTPKQNEVFKRIPGDAVFESLFEIQKTQGASYAILKALVEKGYLRKIETGEKNPLTFPGSFPQGPALNRDQMIATESILSAFQEKIFQTFLLDGVTGSGKTEVYFKAIETAFMKGAQSLVMLPEIALSTQWLQRFRRRFGFEPTIWHSDISDKTRYENWHNIQQGKAKVIVGTRSALFLPYRNLGLIIVDEEHDMSFKQEEKVIYHGRDMAVLRASIEKIPIVLASATPSLETLENCFEKRYIHLHLRTRFGEAQFPRVSLIDLRKEKLRPNHWLSDPIKIHLQKVIDQNHQALIFINRRGYAPVTLCKGCGEKMKCRQCDIALVYHQRQEKMICHHCGYEERYPKACPSCLAEDSFLNWGPGAEKILEELQEAFPSSKAVLATSDTLDSSQKANSFVDAVQNRQIDFIVGTQMISKGYHFPYLTTVVIVDGDTGFSGTDLRASEKTYQILHQVSGRAGRENLEGTILIQTHMPDHPALIALKNYDRDGFLALEKRARQLHSLPPFGRLAALIFSGENANAVQNEAQRIRRALNLPSACEIYGPVPAVISKLRGHYRWRLLIKTPKHILPQNILRPLLRDIKMNYKVRLQLDIDPYSFY